MLLRSLYSGQRFLMVSDRLSVNGNDRVITLVEIADNSHHHGQQPVHVFLGFPVAARVGRWCPRLIRIFLIDDTASVKR